MPMLFDTKEQAEKEAHKFNKKRDIPESQRGGSKATLRCHFYCRYWVLAMFLVDFYVLISTGELSKI